MSFGYGAAMVLAQPSSEEVSDNPSLGDNRLLDEWQVPFGQWMEQGVKWIANNLEPVLDAIAWPFDTMTRFLVRDFLSNVSWLWIVAAMFLIAWLARNLKVACFVAGALFLCGVLGNLYWLQTARTIGFIGVAVIMCVIIGIPVGIACGRVDAVWQVVRPILDAMQVVHSFVYMLPFIWFFGIGEVSATMVTMVFALPPLIRLTNLGIRQVPEDVVEASRAYGAPERRVLFDVQIPLARPAIMTGINQTLLLAISMLGIAAIMGAGGLGALLFRAISNQDTGLAASAGLAFFLVAVVLDRMSQREGADTGSLLKRIRRAWMHRSDPEVLIPDADTSRVIKQKKEENYAAVNSDEVRPMLITLAGGLLAVVSVFLTWTSNAGKLSAYGRWSDASLEGEREGMSFSGLDASGGSWTGIMVLAFGLLIVASVAVSYARPGRGPRWLVVDGALIAAIATLVVSLAHLLARPLNATSTEIASGVVDPGTGSGVLLAVLAGIVAVVGSVLWIRKAPHQPLHPLRAGIGWGQLIGVGAAIVVLVIGMVSGWSFDERREQIITPALQAELDSIRAEMAERPEDIAALSTQFQVTFELARVEDLIVTDGVGNKGAGLGLWALLTGLAAAVTALFAAVLAGGNEQRRWWWNAATAGIGAGVAGISLAWILTHVRSADDGYWSGIGSFLTMIGGTFIIASTMTVLKEFRRSKVYSALPSQEISEPAAAVAVAEPEPVGAG